MVAHVGAIQGFGYLLHFGLQTGHMCTLTCVRAFVRVCVRVCVRVYVSMDEFSICLYFNHLQPCVVISFDSITLDTSWR